MKFDYSKTINEQLPTFDYYKNRYCNYELELINDRKEIERLNNIIKEQELEDKPNYYVKGLEGSLKEYQQEIERLNNIINDMDKQIDNLCNNQKREVDRLNNIINEFDKWLEEQENNSTYPSMIFIGSARHKLQELKDSDKE